MKSARLGMSERPIPVLAPVDTAATAVSTKAVNMGSATHATFYVQFGVISAASADQPVTVTLNASTSSATTSETAIAFKYRLSGAAGTDTLGAVTSATAAGVSIGTTDDGKLLLIDVDPSLLDAVAADAKWVSVLISPDAGGTVTLVNALCLLEMDYAQATPLSAS